MTRRRTLSFVLALALGSALAAAAEDGHDHHEGEEHGQESDHGEHVEGESGHAGEHHEEHDHHKGHGLVRLSSAELDEFGIVVVAAGPGVIETTLEVPGEVQPNGERLAHIVPRYSGIATDVRASIGDHVTQGQVLAIIESDQSLAQFEVTTLISGTVIAKHITLGEAASRDRDIFVIADLSSVWVDLTIYQRDLARVKIGQEAEVYVGHDLFHDTSRISYITPIVDERTRTATARLILPNDNSFWRPGMFVTARVLLERTEVPLVVPRSALHVVEEDTVVFVETEGGFKPQRLSLGRHGESRIEVLSGLSPGDRYVSQGGFTLKAELGKEAFGDGHRH